MSEIRAIYSDDPSFPATDQHPSAKRYQIGGYFVDAIGGPPTQSEVDAVLIPKVLSAEERLANAGLTVAELRTLLGL